MYTDTKHTTVCLGSLGDDDISIGKGGYPEFEKEWQPEDICQPKDNDDSSNASKFSILSKLMFVLCLITINLVY